ncbi:MAG TPA: hypothetical protein VIO80_11795 [Candidatus Dormibacteraeota bacterium]
MSVEAAGRPRKTGGVAPIQALLWRRPWLRAFLLLLPPLGWFVVIYLASLVLLLVTAFWQINDFTSQIEQVWNLDNFRIILLDPTYRLIIGRTDALAAAVTITDAAIAFPFIFHGARRLAPHPEVAVRRGAASPMGELSRARLFMDPHPQPQRAAQLEHAIHRSAGAQHRLHERRDVDRLLLHLASLQ